MQAGETASADEMYAAILLAREMQPRGIVHLHAHFGTSAATVARIAAALSATSFSFTAHAKDIFHESVVPEQFLGKLRDAAAVVSVSDYNVRYLRELYGEWAARVRRVYNGLEIERFPYRPPSDRPARIVAVGRLVEKKGFETLVDACALLRSRGVVVECDLIGTGEREASLRARIEQQRLQRTVVLRGARPQAEVIAAIGNASVLALPCVVGADGNRDGLPTVLIEAMALGTACVATDVTGIPELIEDGRTGLLVAQHDAAGLAAAIERLLVDVPLRVRLAAAARQRIEADFDSRRTAAALREIFVECIGAHARVAAGL
jgi:glycosyltransferase involved in cell wall biosynthesis